MCPFLKRRCPIPILSLSALSIFAWGCSEPVLDLGRGQYEPRYATPEILDAERDAAPGVPTIIATHQWGARALALDETRIYWTTAGFSPEPFAYYVRSCAKTNCAGTLVTYSSTSGDQREDGGSAWGPADRLVVNKSRVFWSQPPSILSCPIEGCSGPPTVIAKPVFLNGLVVDDAYLYWLSTDATILKCPVSGCGKTPELVAKLDAVGNVTLVADEEHLYWGTPSRDASKASTISVVPKDSSELPRVMAHADSKPVSLAIDATNVYWIESPDLFFQACSGSGGSSTEPLRGAFVKACPLTGCVNAPTVLASQTEVPMMLNVNGDRAYWFSPTGPRPESTYPPPSELVERPLTGDGLVGSVLTKERGGPCAMAVDATHVYWTDDGFVPSPDGTQAPLEDGAVKRLRRRPQP